MKINPLSGWAKLPIPREPGNVPDGGDGELFDAKVVSVPNGMNYGIKGHIPCDHYCEFTYAKVVRRLRQSAAGLHWTSEAR